MKWMIELGKQEIKYLSRKAIKRQGLADFLIEIEEVVGTIEEPPCASPSEEPPKLWRVFADGASYPG